MAISHPGIGRSSALPLLSAAVFTAAFLVAAGVASAGAAPLSGQVVGPDHRPVASATVVVAGPLGVVLAETDAAGRFHLPDLAPAIYRVFARAPGLAADAVVVRLDGDGRAGLTLELHVAPITEAVVVVAGQVPRALSEAPAAATVITRTEILNRQLETLSDALRTVPGLAVARNGGPGAVASVFPRGGDSDYTLVLVDGLRQNAFGGGIDLSLLPLGNVEQIEVVRGPQSAVFGADAIGGIVHVTTRHGSAPSVTGRFEGGGDGTAHGTAAGRGTVGQWTFGGSAEHARSDGFTGIAPATGERVSNDDWRSTTAAASLGWTRSAATGVRADVRWTGDERGNPGPFGSNPIGAYTEVDRVSRGRNNRRQAAVDARLPWGSWLAGRVQQRLQITAADFDNRFVSPFGDSLLETRRITGRAQTDLLVSAQTGVSFGLEALAERARSTFITGEDFREVPIERRTVGYFGEVRQQMGRRISLTAGLRVEQIRREALEGNPSSIGPRPLFPADTVVSANPRVGAMLVLWQDGRGAARTRLRASAGTGIRPPDAFEIAFTDNPALKPERSRSVDVGLVHDVRQGLTVEATWFRNRYDDLIVAVGTSFQDASRYRTDNISNARASGVELGASWRGPAGLSARAAYTWLDTSILAVDQSGVAPPPFTVGDRLLRRPRHQGSLSVLWATGRLAAFAEIRGRGRALDVEPSFGASAGLFEAPGFTVVDAGATWHLTPRLDAFARVLNLLDREYEEAYGFPAQRRIGMAGVRVAFRP